MTLDMDDIQEVCSYESIGITINGYVKIYELDSINYSGIEPYECVTLDDEFITFLLKRYKKMYLYDASKVWYNKMPNYITHLILDFSDFTDINLDNLHHGLQSLVIIFNKSDTYINQFDKSLDNLPPTLQNLEIISYTFNKPINLLPQSLTTLTIRSNCFNQSLSNLPNNLYSLTIDTESKYGGYTYLTDELMNLPEGLKELTITTKKLPTNTKYYKPGMLKDEKLNVKIEEEFENTMEKRYPACNINIL
jgi:hypothetical protein